MKFRLPWISRRKHEEALKTLEEAYRENDALQLRCIDRLTHERDRAQGERDEARNVLAPTLERIAAKIVRAEWVSSERMEVPILPRTYRLCLDFEEHIIHQCFEWGGDERVLDVLGSHIGQRAVAELRNMNRRREPIPDTARFIPRNGSHGNPYE